MDKDEILITIIFVILLLSFSLILNNVPFGDVDSSTHFSLGDFQYTSNKVSMDLPYYINETYGLANNGKLWYPPQFHLNGAISQVVSGQRILGPFVFYLLISITPALFLFLFLRKLFDVWVAVIGASFVMFSIRDVLTYIWGVWPEKFSYALVPLILYWGYKTLNEHKTFEYVILGILLSVQFMFHPQGILLTIPTLIVYLLVRNVELGKRFDKKLALTILIMVILIMPFSYSLKTNTAKEAFSMELGGWKTLLKWYPDNIPYNPQFGEYDKMHYGWWTLPFVILGGLIVANKHKQNNYLMLLCWLVAYYVGLHLNIIGFEDRIHRFLNAEAHLFGALFAVGSVTLINLVVLKTRLSKKWVGVGSSILCIILLILGGIVAIPRLMDSYQGIWGVSQYELNYCNELSKDKSIQGDIWLIGVPSYAKRKWLRVLCQKNLVFDDKTITAQEVQLKRMPDYIMFNYVDLIESMTEYDLIPAIQKYELQISNSSIGVGPTENKFIHLYKLGDIT